MLKVRNTWKQFERFPPIHEWKLVLGEGLKPFPLVLAAATAGLIGYQASVPPGTNSGLSILLLLLISIFSGIVGSQLFERWKQINEQGALATKGKSAIRSLNLVLRRVTELEALAGEHEAMLRSQTPVTKVLVSVTLGELRRSANSIAMQVVGAIEEWEDIVPEAKDLQTRIDHFAETRQKLMKSLENEGNLRAELARVEDLRADERAASEHEIAKNQDQINNLALELKQAESDTVRLRAELEQQRGTLGTVVPRVHSTLALGAGHSYDFTQADNLVSGLGSRATGLINVEPYTPPLVDLFGQKGKD